MGEMGVATYGENGDVREPLEAEEPPAVARAAARRRGPRHVLGLARRRRPRGHDVQPYRFYFCLINYRSDHRNEPKLGDIFVG